MAKGSDGQLVTNSKKIKGKRNEYRLAKYCLGCPMEITALNQERDARHSVWYKKPRKHETLRWMEFP